MKPTKVLIAAMFLAFFAGSIWADSVPPDPKITLTAGADATLTSFGLTAAQPIYVLDGSGENGFQLNWGSNVTSAVLYVEDIPSSPSEVAYFLTETFSCAVNGSVATSCGNVPIQGQINDVVGAGLQYPGFEVAFYGIFTSGELLTVSVPEPNTLILLLFGALGAIALLWNRRNAILA